MKEWRGVFLITVIVAAIVVVGLYPNEMSHSVLVVLASFGGAMVQRSKSAAVIDSLLGTSVPPPALPSALAPLPLSGLYDYARRGTSVPPGHGETKPPGPGNGDSGT